ARPGAGGPEIDLLAAQVLEAMDVVARQNMKLRDRQPNDVLNAALKIGRLTKGAKIFEHVGLSDGQVHAAKIQEIIQVGRGAERNDRQNTDLVAVVQGRRYL